MTHRAAEFSRFALVALLAAALTLVSFGHAPVATRVVAVGQSSAVGALVAGAYRLPDGSAPSLCLDGSGTQGESRTHGCDSCRLSAAVALAEPAPCPTARNDRVIARAWPLAEPAPRADRRDSASPPRGPPAA